MDVCKECGKEKKTLSGFNECQCLSSLGQAIPRFDTPIQGAGIFNQPVDLDPNDMSSINNPNVNPPRQVPESR